MSNRAFPILYARDVDATAAFYEALDFTRHFQLPEHGPAGYVGLRRDVSEMAVVADQWPNDRYGIPRGTGPTSEMFIYVDDADVTFAELQKRGATVIHEPADMAWGERVAFVRDPDGNPVAIATAPQAGCLPRSPHGGHPVRAAIRGTAGPTQTSIPLITRRSRGRIPPQVPAVGGSADR